MSVLAVLSLVSPDQFADPRMLPVLEYLHVQPLDNLPTLRLLATRFGMSESHLRHKFREVVGLSLGEYVRRLRFQRARVLLKSSAMSVKQARLEVGMLDHSSFAKSYKKYFGETPTSTRRNADREKWKLILAPRPDLDAIGMKRLA